MKHRSVEEGLRALLRTGDGVSPDGRLPGERELAARFAVSRTTVHRAIDALCKQGVLIQLHGKGTFVKNIRDLRYSQSLYSVTRCAQYYEEHGMHPVTTVLSQQTVLPNETVASYLRVPRDAPVLRIEKLYQADRLILNESVSYLSIVDFPGIEREDFTQPICEVLRLKYGAQPRQTENTIEAVLPAADIARNLRISEQTPILLFESLTTGVLDGRTLPLEYYKTYHRTDHLRFSFTQEQT